MFLVQILLPIYDNERHPLPQDGYVEVRSELTDRFGGLTAHTRAPAEGLWKDSGNETSRDEIVIFEVMTPDLDAPWWSDYRRLLEKRFHQEGVIIRAQEIQML
jgi:hypothetical protein